MSGGVGAEEDFCTDLGLPKCWTTKREQQETAFPILRYALDTPPRLFVLF